ncbi:hypothetical protein BVX95_00215 [archaeon D22]|nr:hypothetical protein BVX95_00215 [archaeon D22]
MTGATETMDLKTLIELEKRESEMKKNIREELQENVTNVIQLDNIRGIEEITNEEQAVPAVGNDTLYGRALKLAESLNKRIEGALDNIDGLGKRGVDLASTYLKSAKTSTVSAGKKTGRDSLNLLERLNSYIVKKADALDALGEGLVNRLKGAPDWSPVGLEVAYKNGRHVITGPGTSQIDYIYALRNGKEGPEQVALKPQYKDGGFSVTLPSGLISSTLTFENKRRDTSHHVDLPYIEGIIARRSLKKNGLYRTLDALAGEYQTTPIAGVTSEMIEALKEGKWKDRAHNSFLLAPNLKGVEGQQFAGQLYQILDNYSNSDDTLDLRKALLSISIAEKPLEDGPLTRLKNFAGSLIERYRTHRAPHAYSHNR